jgi:hypothetical protein
VSNANLKQVPPEYIRKQTLVNGERFFTPELKEYESLILNARERLAETETRLFRQVSRQVAGTAKRYWRWPGPWRGWTSTRRWRRRRCATATRAPSWMTAM